MSARKALIDALNEEHNPRYWGGERDAEALVDAYAQELADKILYMAEHGHPDARVAREDAARFISPKNRICPYTFAHTRHWCGYDTCRDS